MKKILFILCFLAPALVFAQLPFSIKGTGKGFNNGDRIFLTYKTNGRVNVDSTLVAGGAFVLKGTIAGTAQGYLYKNENPMFAEIVHDDIQIYIEAGDILVSTDDSLRNARVWGTSSNEENMILSADLRALQNKQNAANGAFDALKPEQQKDINTIAAFRAQINAINQEMEPIQFSFIKHHPNSYISLVTLNQLSYNAALLQKVDEAYAGLSATIKESPLGKKLSTNLQAKKKAAEGVLAIDFTLPDANGKPVKLSDFKGKYVLVDFWASWCGPCRAENPNIVAAYSQFKSKGFTVLGISLDDSNTKKAWLKAIKTDNLTWTQVSDLQGWKNKAATLYGITQIPANLLIDPMGKIVARNLKDKVLLDKLTELTGTHSN